MVIYSKGVSLALRKEQASFWICLAFGCICVFAVIFASELLQANAGELDVLVSVNLDPSTLSGFMITNESLRN